MSERQRVGLLVPSSNTVMERDLLAGLVDIAYIHSARMYLIETTADAEGRMLDDYLPQAIADIASLRPHITVFGCTSAGALRGLAYDRQLCKEIAKATSGTVISTIAAVSKALREAGGRRISVLTPYADHLNGKIRSSWKPTVWRSSRSMAWESPTTFFSRLPSRTRSSTAPSGSLSGQSRSVFSFLARTLGQRKLRPRSSPRPACLSSPATWL